MKNVNGFSLVELMVALLVVAIGLLGLAGLQATGLTNNHTAYLRTQATVLAQDMADRMRSNPAGLSAYLTPGAASACGAGCTPQQVAGNDRAQWDKTVADQLPGGFATINTGCPPAPCIYTISVTWAEREKDLNGKSEKDLNSASSTILRTVSMAFQP